MDLLKILVIGSGGREHSICWKLTQSQLIDKIYCAPGNPGIAQEAKCEITNIDVLDFQAQVEFCKQKNINFVIVGPDNPLACGIVDYLQQNNIKVFGPNKQCAKLEWSKIYAKEFMILNKIPTAKYLIGNGYQDALAKLKANPWLKVFKADGLCYGKGVYVANDSNDSSECLNLLYQNALNKDNQAQIVMEERLCGIEMSLFLLCDGKQAYPFYTSQDYKRRYDHNQGPNTGGMGAYCPHELYSDWNQLIEKYIIKPINNNFHNSQFNYIGVLYVGIMLVKDSTKNELIPYVLEFNARFGDPETQAMLPLLNSDLAYLCLNAINGNLNQSMITWSNAKSIAVVTVLNQYPNPTQPSIITNMPEETNNFKLFQAGTVRQNDQLIAQSGRVMAAVAFDYDYTQAYHIVYNKIKEIKYNNIDYRKDIALHLVQS